MKTELKTLNNQSQDKIQKTDSLQELESLKVEILGKNGQLTHLLKNVRLLEVEERPIIGKLANTIKEELLDLIEEKKQRLNQKELNEKLASDTEDTTLPPIGTSLGTQHPIQKTIAEVSEIFNRLGFSVKDGPDIESDYYNFEALNIPKDHPARNMHDTFYINSGHLLRTHTSPVQIREMEKKPAPIKIIVPGKVYRCDADVTHSPVFHQIEGLYVDKHVTLSDLKGTLSYFLRELFGQDRKIRFRPSYFPFTEPSLEIDIAFETTQKKGSINTKKIKWMEILGAGMVHKNVFKSVNYSDENTGFAFGMGIERIAMLKYQITNIRLLYENDRRFLKQF